MEVIQSEEQKRKKNGRMRIKDPWDTIKRTTVCIRMVPQEKREGEKGQKRFQGNKGRKIP